MNIYNFYNIIHEKLRLTLDNSFRFDGTKRISENPLNISLREALVNTLMHADFRNHLHIIEIVVSDLYYEFKNPGKMLITTEEFAQGGNSRPRNEKICSFFRLIGAAERQGYGGREIFTTSIKNKLRVPDIETNMEKTSLKIWTVDLSESYPGLDVDSRKVLKSIQSSNTSLSKNQILEDTNLTNAQFRRIIAILIEEDLVQTIRRSL